MLTEKILNIAKNLAALVIVSEQFHQPFSIARLSWRRG